MCRSRHPAAKRLVQKAFSIGVTMRKALSVCLLFTRHAVISCVAMIYGEKMGFRLFTRHALSPGGVKPWRRWRRFGHPEAFCASRVRGQWKRLTLSVATPFIESGLRGGGRGGLWARPVSFHYSRRAALLKKEIGQISKTRVGLVQSQARAGDKLWVAGVELVCRVPRLHSSCRAPYVQLHIPPPRLPARSAHHGYEIESKYQNFATRQSSD